VESDARRLTASGTEADIAQLNRRMVAFERALVDPEGIPGRPWYRHQIFAPRFTYAAMVLPALSEALDAGDPARISAARAQIARALDRAASALSTR